MQKTGYPSKDKTHLQGIPKKKLNPRILSLSMLAIFLSINRGHLDEPCIIAKETISKRKLLHDVKRFIATLINLGINPSDKIAISTPNCYGAIVAMFGANAIGVRVVFFEPSCNDNTVQLQEELILHQPQLLIAYEKDRDWLRAVLENNPSLKVCISTVNFDFVTQFAIRKDIVFKKFAGPLNVDLAIIGHLLLPSDQPMLYLKTSGSTSGKPKTLPFTSKAIYASLIYVSNSTGTVPRDPSIKRVLCNAPIQHGYGWMTLFCNILGGNAIVLAGGTNTDIESYYKMQPTYIYGTSLILKRFMATLPADENLSYLKKFFCAGASITEEEYKKSMAFLKEHGSDGRILNNYGISEGLCIGTAPDLYPHREGSIGKFTLGPKWLIVDEDLNEVKYGESGEAIVAAESLCIEYYNDEKATEKSFIYRDGKRFFKTGDYLTLTEDGYVYFIGRNRRFFFSEGVTDKVNCETIEQALNSLALVEESAVVINRDDTGIEYAKAFVSIDQNQAKKQTGDKEFATAEEKEQFLVQTVRSSVSKILLDYQMPKVIALINEIPYMESGKINYTLLEKIS